MFFDSEGVASKSNTTRIVAEIGVNHNGNLDLAKKMIDEASKAGADYVKFQSFIPKLMASPSTPKVAYQEKSDGLVRTHFEMLSALALDFDQQDELIAHASRAGVSFVSTPYDLKSLEFLMSRELPFIKIASADLVDIALHSTIASSGQSVLISTGGARIEEIETVLDIYRQQAPNKICLLHAVSAYPCTLESLNLLSIPFLREEFGVDVGFSDHSPHPLISSIAATALGAVAIERHFTTDKNLPGPDQAASSNPSEFAALVDAVRGVSASLGTKSKAPHPSEFAFMRTSRKSVHAGCTIAKGEELTYAHVVFLRPGEGISPLRTGEILGRRVLRDFREGDTIYDSDIDWS